MNRLVGLFRSNDNPTPSHSSQNHQTTSSSTTSSINNNNNNNNNTTTKDKSWWIFSKSDDKKAPNPTNQRKKQSPAPRIVTNSAPQDESYETIVFKLPPCDPKLKSETQIKRIRRFSRFLSSASIEIKTLAQQTWLGCPNPYRGLVWSYLLGYIPTTTSSAQHNQKKMISLQRKRTEYAKSIFTSYYTPRHHLSHEYQYPLYKSQRESPEKFSEPPTSKHHNTTNTDENSHQNHTSNNNDQVNMMNQSTNAIDTPSNSTNGQNISQNVHNNPQNINPSPFNFDPLQPFSPFDMFNPQPTQPLPQNSITPSHATTNNNGPTISQADKQLLHQIRIDLPRTLTTYQVVQLPQLQALLERVLFTWAVRHPAASYVQGMNDLCAMITLIVLEQAMWSRVGMCNGYLDVHHYKETVIDGAMSAKNSNNNNNNNVTSSTPHTTPKQSSYYQHNTNNTPHSTNKYDIHNKPHVINKNEDMFSMYECEKPINNFSQAFFDIHLHHHTFSWLFYLSELSSKALELVNTPDDRLLHNYTSNVYNVNPTTSKSNQKNEKNDPKSEKNEKNHENNNFQDPSSVLSTPKKSPSNPFNSAHNNTGTTSDQEHQNDHKDDDEFTYIGDMEGNLSQQQHDFIQKTLETSFIRVDELYKPSEQHVFNKSVTFETIKPSINLDRNVKKITSIPALDLSTLVPVYKRITTTYWSRDMNSGQHQPNIKKGDDIDEKKHSNIDTKNSSNQTKSQGCDDKEPIRHDSDSLVQDIDDFTSENSVPTLDLNTFESTNSPIDHPTTLSTPKNSKKDNDDTLSAKRDDLSIDISRLDDDDDNLFSSSTAVSPSNTQHPPPSEQPSIQPTPRNMMPQLGIPTTTVTHSISPQTAIATLSHLLCPITLSTIECDIYWLFTLLIDIVQDNYINKQPGIHRMITKLESLCKRVDPLLSNWLFDENHVFPIQFAFRWFNCLFVRELPFQYGTRLWDVALSNLYIKKQPPQQQQQQQQQLTQSSLASSYSSDSGKNQPYTPVNAHNTKLSSSLSSTFDANNHQNVNSSSNNNNNNNTNEVGAFQLVSTNIPHLTTYEYDDTQHLSLTTPRNNTNDVQLHGDHEYQSKRNDIDIESFEDCFVYFGVSLLTFFRRIFFAGRISANRQQYDDHSEMHHDDNHGGFGIGGNNNNNNGIFVEHNSKNTTTFSPIDFDESVMMTDDCVIDILDTPSIYHYHLAGVPFSVLTNSNGSLSNTLNTSSNNINNTGNNTGGSGVLGLGSLGLSGSNGGNNNGGNNVNTSSYTSNDNSITFSNNYYPSILYLPRQLTQTHSSTLFGNNNNKDREGNNNNNNNNGNNNNNNNKAQGLNPHGNDDILNTVSPESLHTMQQELLYNNIYRHHTDCIHNHQYDKNTQNITISLQYIDPVTHSAITMITKPDYTSVTSMTQVAMMGTTVFLNTSSNNSPHYMNNHNNNSHGNDQQQMLSPHGIAIINNAAYIELGLPKKWVLDNFGDIIIFVQQHIPTVTQSLWVSEDLETCLSKMYLLQNTFSFQLPNA